MVTKRAVVFIHGIGQQQRYETVESLVNGLVEGENWERVPGEERGPALVVPNSPTPITAIRLRSNGGEKTEVVDFFEVYWAPLTQGKTSFPSVLKWLLTSSFVPFFRMGSDGCKIANQAEKIAKKQVDQKGPGADAGSTDKDAVSAAPSRQNDATASEKAFLWNGRQPGFKTPFDALYVLFAVLLVIVFVIVAVLLARQAAIQLGLNKVAQALLTLQPDFQKIWTSCPGNYKIWLVLVIFQSYFFAQFGYIVKSMRTWYSYKFKTRQRNAIEKSSSRYNYKPNPNRVIQSALRTLQRTASNEESNLAAQELVDPLQEGAWRAGGFWAAVWLMAGVSTTAVMNSVAHLTTNENYKLYLLYLSALFAYAAVALGKTWLVNFVGDIQVYTGHDENESFFKAREEILNRAMCLTRTVLKSHSCAAKLKGNSAEGEDNPKDRDTETEPNYEKVYVVAHSLGSVIGYDMILRLYDEQRDPVISPEMEQQRIKPEHFAKLASFVSFGSPLAKTYFFLSNKSVQSQLRFIAETIPDKIDRIFEPSTQITTYSHNKMRWFNYWYWNDIIANPLFATYDRVFDRRLKAPKVLWAHSQYYLDSVFTGDLTRILRETPLPLEPQQIERETKTSAR